MATSNKEIIIFAEIQKKLFLFGYKWYDRCTKVNHTDAPFLYINQAHYTVGAYKCQVLF